jgi:hypothetical protein
MPWRFDNLTTQLGRRAVFGLSAFAQTFPHIRHVFFQGRNADGSGDGHIHEFYWDGIDTTTGWHHNDLTNNTHAPLAADIGFPSSYMFKGSGTQHVIYQGLGDAGRINELWWDGDWHHNDLTSAAGNAPLTIGLPFGYEYSFFDTIGQRNIISQRVVYHTSDNRLHLLYWVGANRHWHHMPLPGVPGVGSRPTAYVFSVQGQAIQGQASQRVLYLSRDLGVEDILHVHELTWNEQGLNNSNWVPNDLTVLTGAPPLGPGDSDPVGLMHDLEFTLHVFYGREQDRHLYELYWNDSGWHVNDLTATMGVQPVGGRPLAYVHLGQGTLNINFVATDGHIHALWRDVGTPWNSVNQQNLTMPLGAPPPLTQPVGFVFQDLTQHMFYIADNSPPFSRIGDIIELTDADE